MSSLLSAFWVVALSLLTSCSGSKLPLDAKYTVSIKGRTTHTDQNWANACLLNEESVRLERPSDSLELPKSQIRWVDDNHERIHDQNSRQKETSFRTLSSIGAGFATFLAGSMIVGDCNTGGVPGSGASCLLYPFLFGFAAGLTTFLIIDGPPDIHNSFEVPLNSLPKCTVTNDEQGLEE